MKKLIIFTLLIGASCFSQSKFNGTNPPDPDRYISKVADGTDITSIVQNAIDARAGGRVFLPIGSFNITELTVSNGVQLIGAGTSFLSTPGTILTYTGSGDAITIAVSGGSVSNLKLDRATQGGRGIVITGGEAHHLFIHNFTTCVMVDGSSNGVYFATYWTMYIDACGTGLDTHNTGPNTVNSNTFSGIVVQHSNIGIHICSLCIGNTINGGSDASEFFTGANPIGMYIEGPSTKIRDSWAEWNANKTWTGTGIGIKVTGAQVSVKGVSFPQADGSGWQNYSYIADTERDNPYNNASGSIVPDVFIPNTTIATVVNCSSSASPAVCTSAPAGSVVVAAAATTVVVNTTAVTANSQIFVTYDSSLGTKLGVTCNVTEPALYGVTARTASTSFTITSSAPITNPACFSYFIVN